MKKSINQSLEKFWSIAKLYWFSSEKVKAFGLLSFLILLLLFSTLLSVGLNAQQGVIISALSVKETSLFWNSILSFLIILIVYAPVVGVFNYVSGKLGNYWRRWLTSNFLSSYLKDRNFYDFVSNSEIDNPDQRISEDIRSFTQESLRFFLLILGYIFQLFAFSVVLFQIYQPLFFVIIIYSLIGTTITVFIFSKPLVSLRFEQLKNEANFRFGLIRIRDNAESIAFYQGEKQECRSGEILFNEVFANFNKILNWQFYLDCLGKLFGFVPYAIPPILLAGKVFSGELEVGKVSEAIGAFIVVFTSLSFVVEQFQSLTSFGAGIERLYSFSQILSDKIEGQYSHQTLPERIEIVRSSNLACHSLTLLTPNLSKTLFYDLSFELNQGKTLLITGASGSGKSSLLRAIAGLWNSGSGKIARQNLDQIIFLPQRPYMTTGSLRRQFLYPNVDLSVNDDRINDIVRRVNLYDLVERIGSLDIEKPWHDTLSIGEMQRVAFARLLINQPTYAILDEATSALDIDNECNLYTLLQQSEISFISVGHRSTLEKYHDFRLEIFSGGKWELKELAQ